MNKILLALTMLVCSSFVPTGCYVNFTEDDYLWLAIGCVKNLKEIAEQALQESPTIKAYVEQQIGRTIGSHEELIAELDRMIEICESELFDNPALKAKAMSLLWYWRAAHLYKAHEYVQANADLDIALNWYPNNPLVHFGKSRVYEKLGATEQAAQYAQKAVQLGIDVINAKKEIAIEL